MRKYIHFSLMLGAVSLYTIIPAVAQAPGGAGRTPTTTQQQPGINNPNNNPNSTDQMMNKVDDKQFLKEAAVRGMTEVELAKLATQKGETDAVKQFGQKVVDEHGKTNDELKELAGSDGVTIPASLDSKHQSRIDKLAKLSGTQFDRAFIKDELKEHEQDIRDFQREAQGGTEPKVKDFASKNLPALQSHLKTLKDLDKEKLARQ
jgi:putative membrane protein